MAAGRSVSLCSVIALAAAIAGLSLYGELSPWTELDESFVAQIHVGVNDKCCRRSTFESCEDYYSAFSCRLSPSCTEGQDLPGLCRGAFCDSQTDYNCPDPISNLTRKVDSCHVTGLFASTGCPANQWWCDYF